MPTWIETDARTLKEFFESLGQEFYRSVEAAMEALAREQMFINIVHLETGFKVELIVRKSRPFSRIEFSRRQAALYLGKNRWFATPEDIILAKLEWSKMSGSERQFTDALSVAKLQKREFGPILP